MKGKKIHFEFVNESGCRQREEGIIEDTILVNGNTKYLVRYAGSWTRSILPHQILEIL